MLGTFKQTDLRPMWLARCWPGDDLLVLTILSRRSRRESIVLTLATRYCCPLDQPPASRFLPPRSGLERSDFVLWPNPVLLWDHRVRRLLEGKRTRYARHEIFRVCPGADLNCCRG